MKSAYELAMEKLEKETAARWPGVKVRIAHRIGKLEPGETSVFIAAAGAHRDESFAALRHAIDRLAPLRVAVALHAPLDPSAHRSQHGVVPKPSTCSLSG